MNRPLNPYGVYYAYLRKSRADRDAEAHGEGETLLRHETLLRTLATQLGITIQKFYREVVSGETIQDRPVVQELLNDISTGVCDGVLVVEVERLARGDTSDQGTIANYFKFSDTLIITPAKIYDPTDDFDEEYFEFGLFMSRREYKTINRRIQRGRMASLKEGKWICSTAPDGYNRIRIKNDKGYTLEPNERASVVQLIFRLRLIGEEQSDGSYRRLGHYLIAKRLDSLGIKPLVGDKWSPSTIKDILHNHAYIGMVTWGKKPEKKIMVDGKIKKVRTETSDFQIFKGIHPALIDEDVFYKVQELENQTRAMSTVVSNKVLKNPLSGIVKCGKCGSSMTRRVNNGKDRYYNLCCPNRYCNTVSSPIYLIEEKLLESLQEWLDGYILHLKENDNNPFPTNESQILETSLKNYEKELSTLKEQHAKTFDLLEQGVYSPEIFQERSSILSGKINTLIIDIDDIKRTISEKKQNVYKQEVYVPEFQRILNVYFETESAQVRNDMLKTILDSVDYTKDTPNKKFCRNNANFKLVIHPKLPKF